MTTPQQQQPQPDLTLGAGLVDSARILLQSSEEPTQASLRLAAIGAYYAAFLYLAEVCADTVVGATEERRASEAWAEMHRSLTHKDAKRACNELAKKLQGTAILKFLNELPYLQEDRISANYNTLIRTSKSELKELVVRAERAIKALRDAEEAHRIMLVVRIFASGSGVQDTRARADAGTQQALRPRKRIPRKT